MDGYSDFTITWALEDDGTYSKIKVMWKDHGPRSRIKKVVILEAEVSKEEYFRRKLANKL